MVVGGIDAPAWTTRHSAVKPTYELP